MKGLALTAGFLAGAMALAVWGGICQADPVPRVVPPAPDNPGAYQPVPMPKPLPMDPPPPPPSAPAPNPPIRHEEFFVKAYEEHRSPRMMVFVNRTVTGEKETSTPVQSTVEQHSATGAVNVNNQASSVSSGTSSGAGPGGATASSTNSSTNSSGSFSSGGPANYTKSTTVTVANDKYDSIGASAADYEMIEASLVKYFDNSGKVHIQDSDAVRAKLDREKVLRIENGDPAAVALLSTEFQQDILIRVTATPTAHSDKGPAVRIIAKAVSTADCRNLGTAFVDMPLPMVKQNINVFTRYLAGELMGEMTKKWAGVNGAGSTVEIRIYKTAGVDDALKVRKWLQATRGVGKVETVSASGGSKTAYASFRVVYAGAPEDLYADLKDAIGASQGLKAVDVQNSTVNLEVTGQLNLVTTTRKTESTTTTTTNVIEEKKIEPINPAPPQ